MEMEYFVPPGDAPQWFEYWTAAAARLVPRAGRRAQIRLRLRPHEPDELSHYSSQTSDIEYLFPIGWSELEGIANRGDFDLRQHAEYSGETLEYFDPQSGERYVPHVIEPAAGADRATLAFLVDAYDEEEVEGETRTVLRLHPRLAPVKVGGPAAAAQATASRSSRARSTTSCAASCSRSTTRAARSAAATAARTRSARRGA